MQRSIADSLFTFLFPESGIFDVLINPRSLEVQVWSSLRAADARKARTFFPQLQQPISFTTPPKHLYVVFISIYCHIHCRPFYVLLTIIFYCSQLFHHVLQPRG